MSSKIKKTIFICSLCLNLLLVGGIAGGIYRAKNIIGNGEGPREVIGAMMMFGPDEMRENFRGNMRKSFSAHREKMPGGRMEEFVEIMSAPELDIEKLENYFEQSRDFNREMAKRAHEEMISSITSLSAEERLEFAEKLTKHLERRKKRNH